MKLHSFPLAAALFCVAGLGHAQTVTPTPALTPWDLDVGLNYVTGDYGLSQDTDVWVQTTTINYEQDVWHLSATVPLISITGPASVVGNVSRADTSTERGLGDITLAAAYKITNSGTGRSDFDFTTRVKLPTANEDKGLGTGKTDFNFELNYHHTIGRVTPFATLGYRFLGHSAAYPLKDGFYTTLGVATPIAQDGTTAGLALTWRERIVDGADNAEEAMVFLSHPLNTRWKLQGYALTGFTDASPNLGLGGLIGYKF
jgi:hypothetical protein